MDQYKILLWGEQVKLTSPGQPKTVFPVILRQADRQIDRQTKGNQAVHTLSVCRLAQHSVAGVRTLMLTRRH